MKLIRVGPVGAERPAIVLDNTAYDVSSLVSDFDRAFWESDGLEKLRLAASWRGAELPMVDLGTTRMGSPVPAPSKIVCIGLNYLEHIKEAGAETPNEPVVFLKAPNTVVGPNDDVILPPGSRKTDYEVELAVVIGSVCRYLPDETSGIKGIGGFAISNDISEREYQLERGGQWVKGKSSETFNPLGPYLVTPEEVADFNDLGVELKVNGETRQKSHTSDMLFSVGHIIWYLSQFMVLEPGDIINTGTPPGVALGMAQPKYLEPGDVIEACITGLGEQRQTCKQFMH